MKMKKKILLPRGPENIRGIRYGEPVCTTSFFSLEIPIYINDLIIEKEIEEELPFGGNTTRKEYFFTDHITDEITEIILSVAMNISKTENEKFIDSFSIDIMKDTPLNRYTCNKIITYQSNIVHVYFNNKTSYNYSYGMVCLFMEKLRSRFSKVFQKYKPVEYKKGKRKVLYETEKIYLDKLPF